MTHFFFRELLVQNTSFLSYHLHLYKYKISDDESCTRNQIFGCISNNSQKKMGRTRVFFNFLPIFWQNVTIFHRTKSGFRVLDSLLHSYIILCVGGERNQSEWCSSNTYFILMENKKRAQFLMKYHCASARFYLGFYFSIKKILVVGDGSWSSFGQPRKCSNLKKGNNFEKDANFVVLKKLTLTKNFLNIFFFVYIRNKHSLTKIKQITSGSLRVLLFSQILLR